MKRRLWERLLAKVHIPPGDVRQVCWEWTGAYSKKRYGQYRPSIWRDGVAQNAARVVCELLHGPPPQRDYHAGHTCPQGENERCISPFHLVWQSPIENYTRRRHG